MIGEEDGGLPVGHRLKEGSFFEGGEFKLGHALHDKIYQRTQPCEPAKIAMVSQPGVTTWWRNGNIDSAQVFVSIAQQPWNYRHPNSARTHLGLDVTIIAPEHDVGVGIMLPEPGNIRHSAEGFVHGDDPMRAPITVGRIGRGMRHIKPV